MPEPRESQHLDSALQTRERILNTAARLFSEHGYDHTSLSHVARDAQVSKALILWHFDSKEKLLGAALGRTLESYSIDVNDLAGLDEPARIALLIDQFHRFIRDNVYSVRFLLSLVLRVQKQPDEIVSQINDLYRVFRCLLADIIESGRQNGRFRADVHPQLDASLILATLDGIMIEHFMSGEFSHDPSELLTHLKRTALDRLIA